MVVLLIARRNLTCEVDATWSRTRLLMQRKKKRGTSRWCVRDNTADDGTAPRVRDNAFPDIFFSPAPREKPEASYATIFPAALLSAPYATNISQPRRIPDAGEFMSGETHSSALFLSDVMIAFASLNRE